MCYHCGHRFDASQRAISAPCPKCSKPLQIGDVVIKQAHSVRKIQTCGRLIVSPRGRVVAQVVEAMEGVEVSGYLEAAVTSGGPVTIGPKAKWKGDCKAPSLAVELGAVIERGYFVIPDDSLLHRANGNGNGAKPARNGPTLAPKNPTPTGPNRMEHET